MNIIERRIQFYQVMWIKGDRYLRKDLNFLNSFLSRMPMITTADESFNIFIENFDNGSIGRGQDDKSFWKISKIRKYDLPLKFNTKDLKSTTLDLKDDEGLQEPSHFVVFNGAFIGAELNFNAPRVATTLYREINKFLESNPNDFVDSIEINPILREDAYKKIDKMDEISSILIKIPTNYAMALNQTEGKPNLSLAKTFSSAQAAEDMFLGVQFYVGRYKKPRPRSAFKYVLSGLKEMFSQPDWFNNIEAAKVRGRQFGADSQEVVDLLEDTIMVRRNITKLDPKTKAVDPVDMYQKIVNSYNSSKSDIDKYSSPITR